MTVKNFYTFQLISIDGVRETFIDISVRDINYNDALAKASSKFKDFIPSSAKVSLTLKSVVYVDEIEDAPEKSKKS